MTDRPALSTSRRWFRGERCSEDYDPCLDPSFSGYHTCLRASGHEGWHTCGGYWHEGKATRVCGRWYDGGPFVPTKEG